MSTTTPPLENQLLKQFNDYDQTVDVVSCWQVLSKALMDTDLFYRFVKLSPGDLTPDFGVVTTQVKRKNDVYAGPGSFICDVKKFPHPYRDDEDTPNYQAYDRSLEQLKKYAVPLKAISAGLPTLFFSEHDIVLLTKSELSDIVYKYLSQTKINKPFNIGRPLVLVEYSYEAADQQERYVFRWKQGENNSPFTHAKLNKEMVVKAQPLKVFPKMFVPCKIKNVLCNDAPPSIYLLVFIWLEIFPGLLSEDEFAVWQSLGNRSAISIRTSPEKVITAMRESYTIPVRISSVRDCFATLVATKKARKVSDTEYEISFSNLTVRSRVEESQEGLSKRRETREYGEIFARLIAKASELRSKSSSTPRKARSKTPLGQTAFKF